MLQLHPATELARHYRPTQRVQPDHRLESLLVVSESVLANQMKERTKERWLKKVHQICVLVFVLVCVFNVLVFMDFYFIFCHKD